MIEGLLVILGFFVLVLLRFPLYIALLVPAAIYFLLSGFNMLIISQKLIRTYYSFSILAVPVYIYVGSLMNTSGISRRIFDFANDVVGHLQGGLCHVNIIASLIFSGMSGSALADIGGIGQVLIETMKDEGYDNSFTAALTASSATVGPIFPPSIPLILYGLIAEQSIVRLLLAGIFPALVTVALLMIGIAVLARFRDFPEPQPRSNMSEIVSSTYKALPAIGAPIILIAGLLNGNFGATEAAAITVVYMVLSAVLFYGQRNMRFIWDAAIEAAKITSVVMIALGGAALFSHAVTLEGTPRLLADILLSISQNPIAILVIVNVMLLIIGLFLEPISALFLSIPLVVPPLTEIGVDPVHIGVIMVFNLMIGLLTPPLGLALFVAGDLAEAPHEKVLKELAPFYAILISALGIVTFFPEFVLWIPNLV